MINRRLIGEVGESKKYIAGNVILQWISLLGNIVMMFAVTGFLVLLYEKKVQTDDMIKFALLVGSVILIRSVCAFFSARMSYLSSKMIKKVLREKIYEKLLKLGASYRERVQTSEVVQVAVEGVDQLETYFGSYLPQFFYAILAPLTLFAVLLFVSPKAAVVLLVCVPLIPIAIAGVSIWAKKLLSKYWGQYTALGDTFLENLQGLTTLKIYQADEYKNQKMNEESEKFRKITMKVLTMQLNSITIMDFIAYGGAALGIIIAVMQYKEGNTSFQGALLIILLAADFFLPMRQLGSFFHIAMNGMAASDKIFALLDLPVEKSRREKADTQKTKIRCENLHFSYEKGCEILKGVTMDFPCGKLTAIVGESGCGKSTVASLVMGRNRNYAGKIMTGETELQETEEKSLMQEITYLGHQSYLFRGTVRENLQMGNENATENEMWDVLKRVNLAAFLQENQGLDTVLAEQAVNLSGGQRQRLAFARALLHDSRVYIFDEATSNIDVESENKILEQILLLAKHKTVLFISHRLANLQNADYIYVLKDGVVTEEGVHEELLRRDGYYARLYLTQKKLEEVGKEA